MATYCGGRFIREQLESLAAQSHLPFELVVCDDGSNDDTLDYLEEFALIAPFPVHIHRNAENLGFADSFIKAAGLCRGDWIGFCDQDDVWWPNRIADVHRALKTDSRAILTLQNAILCREDLTHHRRLFPAHLRSGFHRPRSQYGFWVWPGFLQTVKADIFLTCSPENRPRNYYHPGHRTMSHDRWTCLLGNATGGILVLPDPAAFYRRHGAAMTGSYEERSWSQRIAKAFSVGGEHYAFLGGVASETAEYLRSMAENGVVTCAQDLLDAARGFDRIAEIRAAKAALYGSLGMAERLQKFFQITRLGGYIGPAMIAMGWKSAIKDILVAIGLVRRKAA